MRHRLLTPQFIRLTAVHFLYCICLNVFIPILPLHYHSMGMSDFEIGLIIGAISIGGALFRVPAGKSLNIYGTAPVLALGIILSLAGIAGHFFATSPPTAILSASLQGLGLACYGSASLTMASFMFDDKEIVDVFAIFTMSGLFGVSLSLGAANWLYDLGGIKYTVCAGLAAASAALILFPKRPIIVTKVKQAAALAVSKIVVNPKIYIPTISIFTTHFSFSGAMTFLPLLMLSRGINDFDVFFVSYSISVVIFRVMIVRLCHTFELRHLESLAVAAAGGAMLAIAAAESRGALILCGVLLGLTMGTGYPVMGATVAESTSPVNRSVALSLFASSADLGLVTGAAGLAVIAGFWDYSTVFFMAGLTGICYTFLHRLRLVKKLAPDDLKQVN